MAQPLAIVVGPASTRLGASVADILGIPPVAYDCRRFPDGEMELGLLESVRGRDVYLLQSTSPPVDTHLLELLLLADACRRAGADRMTAVMPYFGYARQDRRTMRRSLGARVAADIVTAGRFDRVMLVDAHTASLEGFFDIPVDHLTAVPVLGDVVAKTIQPNAVVIAPDLGAVKLAREYARRMRLPMAFVHKTRITGEQVETHGVIGDVSGLDPLIVDDMVSTGGTVAAAIGALRAAGAGTKVTVAVTHALLVGRARGMLHELGLARFIATDTVAGGSDGDAGVETASVAPLIATAIRRHHFDESLADLRAGA